MNQAFYGGWKEVTRVTGYSKWTIMEWYRSAGFPLYYLPGGSPAVIPAEVQEWLRVYNEKKGRKKSKK